MLEVNESNKRLTIDKEYTMKSDVFSLGEIFLEVLSSKGEKNDLILKILTTGDDDTADVPIAKFRIKLVPEVHPWFDVVVTMVTRSEEERPNSAQVYANLLAIVSSEKYINFIEL